MVKNTEKDETVPASLFHALHKSFSEFAQRTSHATGQPLAFLLAVAVVLVWALTGPLFHYSDTWQLVINTGTTIVTFLMVFLIQNTQNRDTLAFHLKLSELVFAVKGAKDSHAALENLSDDELEQLHAEFCQRAEQAHGALSARRGGQPQTAAPAKTPVKKSRRPARRKAIKRP
jgi:low affinity Fe/Cu permease